MSNDGKMEKSFVSFKAAHPEWMPADPSAPETGPLPHVLKVFLIDRLGSIREIYTTSFLQPQMVLNDIETLLLEDGAPLD